MAESCPRIRRKMSFLPRARCGFSFLYQEGQGQSRHRIQAGKEAVIALLGPDEFVGEDA